MWYDVKWRRPGDPEVLEAQGLTGDQMAFRLRGVIRMCGSVEVLSVTFAKGPPPRRERLDMKVFGDGDGTNYEFPTGEDSGIGGA